MRRFFLPLTFAAVILGTVNASADIPAPSPTIDIVPGDSGVCYFHNVLSYISVGNQIVTWNNETDVARTVTQREGLFGFTVGVGGRVDLIMHSAGSLLQQCDGGQFYSPIPVAPVAPRYTSNARFTVTWADSSAPSTNLYTVQYRIGKTGEWKAWKTRVPGRSAPFNGVHGKTYQFRALTRTSSTAYTDFGPQRTVTVK